MLRFPLRGPVVASVSDACRPCPSYEEISRRVNWHKSQLDRLSAEQYRRAFLACDRYGNDLRDQCKQMLASKPRFAALVPAKSRRNIVTIAFLKSYELLTMIDLASTCTCPSTFHSLHLAEAPGTFIVALDHYLSCHATAAMSSSSVSMSSLVERTALEWWAETYRPRDVFAGSHLDDMFGLEARYPKRWLWGASGDGDLTDADNVEWFVRRFCESRTRPLLVTADGGFDVGGDYANQEQRHALLLLGQAIIGASCVDSRGTFVLKSFGFLERESRSVLAFLLERFERVDLIKPSTSKEANNELYVVCQRLRPDIAALDPTEARRMMLNPQELPDMQSSSELHLRHALHDLADRQCTALDVLFRAGSGSMTQHERETLALTRRTSVREWLARHDL